MTALALGPAAATRGGGCGGSGGGGGREPSPPAAADDTEAEAEAAAAAAQSATAVRAAPLCGVSASADAPLFFLRVDPAAGTLAVAATAAAPSAGVGDAALRADGRVAATAHWDGRVRLWHARRGAALGVLRYHSKAAAAAAFAGAHSGLLASGGRDGAVAVWSVFADGGGGGGAAAAAAAAGAGDDGG